MKKTLFSMLLLLATAWMAEAQNRSIQFEQGKAWKEIVAMAKKARKMVFVDCYTSTCPPCKALATRVFTNDTVADYFNRTFVNAKFDMQKDQDGLRLRSRYQVSAYPTLLFIDPQTEKLVHRSVGFVKPDVLISRAALAFDSRNNLSGMTARYQAGENSKEFMGSYIRLLAEAYRNKELAALVPGYLDRLTDEEFYTEENWKLFKNNVPDPFSRSFQRMMDGRERLSGILPEKEDINGTMWKKINAVVEQLYRWTPGKAEFDGKTERALISLLMESDLKQAPGGLAYLYAAESVRNKDYKGMMDGMQEAMRLNVFAGDPRNFFFFFLKKLEGCTDRNLIEKGLAWLEDFSRGKEESHYLNAMLPVKAQLLKQLGREQEAAQALAEKEIQYEKVISEIEKKLNIKIKR